MIDFFEPEKLRMIVLPGHPRLDFGARGIYDDAYSHFKSVWEKTFTRRAGIGAYDPYGFFRQDFSINLVYEGKIVAQICQSLLHLEDRITSDLSYFSNFKGRALEVMCQEGAKALATAEYSSVAREFSPRKIGGLCLNEIINHLCSKNGFHYGADVITGLPRRVTGTTDKTLKLGFRKVGEQVERLGLLVDVVIGFEKELMPHEDPSIQMLIEKLWNERMDLASAQTKKEKTHGSELDGSL